MNAFKGSSSNILQLDLFSHHRCATLQYSPNRKKAGSSRKMVMPCKFFLGPQSASVPFFVGVCPCSSLVNKFLLLKHIYSLLG